MKKRTRHNTRLTLASIYFSCIFFLLSSTAFSSQDFSLATPELQSGSIPAYDAFSLEGLMQVTIDSKTPRNQKDVSSTVYVYTKEDILKHGWNSISDIFQHIPGVDYSFNGSGYFVSARGVPDYTLNGSKTVIMIDGHDMSNSSFNSTSYQGFQKHFDVRSAKRIEVLVGAGSTLHGANAYGLVVNIITRDIEDINLAEATITVGTNDDFVPSINLVKRWGKWGGFLSGTYWKQDKDDLAEVVMRVANDGSAIVYDNDTYNDNYVENYTVHGYVDYDNLIRAGYILSKEHHGLGTTFISKDVGMKRTTQHMMYLDINYLFSSRLEYKLKSHFRKSIIGKDDVLLILEPTNSHTTILSESYSLVLDNQITYRLNNTLRILGGLFTEYTRQSPIGAKQVAIDQTPEYANYPAKEDWHNYAFYAQAEWHPLQKLRSTIGVRFINSVKQYDSEVLPRLGLVYTLPQGINIKFNYQRGYRPPSVGEIGNTASFYFRNDNLQSETIDTIEVGLFSELAGKNSLYSNFYYSKLNDVIRRENKTEGLVWDVNTESISVVGSEIGGKLYIGNNLILSGDISHTTSSEVNQVHLNKVVIPTKLNFSLDAKPVKNINVVLDAYIRLEPSTATDNTIYEEKPGPNWYLMNLNIVYNKAFLTPDLTLVMTVKNLFNDSYGLMERRGSHIRYPDYHPQPLRSALLTMRYQI